MICRSDWKPSPVDEPARDEIPQRLFELRRQLAARRGEVVEEQRAVLAQRVERGGRGAGRRILRLLRAAHGLQQPAEIAAQRERDRRRALRRCAAPGRRRSSS